MTSASARYTSPFTAYQWQELEHQALIYKYITSGVPVPPELIYTLKRSMDSSLSSGLLFQQTIGSSWEGCFQMGFGRKADPEPWRCRRTDGKKWRCAKEAHPDSKYCEKHMHRGKNRSRKPVEASSTPRTPPPKTSSNLSSSISSINRNFSPNLTTTTSAHSLSYPFLYTPNSSTSKPFDAVLSAHKHTSTHQLFLDSSNDKDQRDGMDKGYVVKELPPGRSCCLSVTCEPLTSPYYSQTELQNMNDNLNNEQEQQSCFLWGTEFKSSSRQTKAEGSDGDPTQKPLHHFFGEWPPKDAADSWL